MFILICEKGVSPVSAIFTCKLFISPVLFAHLAYSVMEKHVLNGLARSFIYFKLFIFFSGAASALVLLLLVLLLPRILSEGIRQKLL